MSTGTRRLNFTRRQRLKREHIRIGQSQPSGTEPLFLSAEIDLSPYALPAEGRVFVEAYRSAAWQRFDFGTVGAMAAPTDRAMHDFGSGDGVLFRVKVVEPASNGAPAAGRILAQADSIPANQEGRPRSILPIERNDELRDEVWRLVLDDETGPMVEVSGPLVADRQALARSPAFLSLALPEVLRRILRWSLEEGRPEEDDWHKPRGVWIRFALDQLLRERDLRPELDDAEPWTVDHERWVNDAVTKFCRLHHIDRVFGKWWKGDGSLQRGGEA